MAYKRNTESNAAVNSIDLETVLRYRRRGIKLTPEQEQIVKASGIYEDTEAEKVDLARTRAITAMKSPDGQKAIDGGYYTELFNYFFHQVRHSGNLVAPYPIPEAWLALGSIIRTSGKTDYRAGKLK